MNPEYSETKFHQLTLIRKVQAKSYTEKNSLVGLNSNSGWYNYS